MVKRKEIFIFLLLLILSIFFIYVYNEIKTTKKDIYARIEAHQIEQTSAVIKNIQNEFISFLNLKNSNDLRQAFSDNKNREKYEHIISLMLSSNIKYAYILYKDDRDKFRFILDASKIDKANFYQKFDVNETEYINIYTTKKPQIIKQKEIENLYITVLHPIIVDNEVIGIFSVDMTSDIQKTILKSIKPLETFFIILIIFILLLMIMTIMQIFHYFITRRKIFTDSLTRTFNRNYLEDMSSILNLTHYSLAMLDLDKFKMINDTYGHKGGDYILFAASKVFKNSIRDSDILVRYGGEEFLLLINNRGANESTLDICKRLKNSISKERFFYDGHEIKMTVSIGLHKHPYLEKNLQEAIKKADEVLYLAKRNGRNRIEIYDEKIANESSFSSKNISFVKEALDEDRVVCYYQPIYDYNSGEIYKYEALVRIVAKDNTIVGPYEFLPQIKNTNIHYKLTQRILHVVFEEIKRSKKDISVNINFSDLANKDIEESIVKHLKSNPDLASKVTFEILESSEVDDAKLFKEKTNLIHALGAKVSIDDFGSGYSNFKTIIDIEANYLKIDGSLIKNIDVNIKDYKVVKSIIHFAAQSNMKTIAEFVHSKEVFDKLVELNVDYMQGFYISTPKATLIEKEELFR
ncbi:MAG: diguanylate cyclase [Sulfurimonas sp. RIFOXYD12_FULL_33_39]|uniref:EAL domain-containing protein n=1 Tax=unclassified Sulfurimonas TaxID=2623549 RepID=UPI0008D8BFA3|nr:MULTISPECIES: EAL domain-containing protein [unclassified Sulfurimonas]OHE00511.1 MAG: diguanylate cyclase [Sulfurimonas sp. RIFCSPLOWO2_12_FULL_34_6]OHE10564.1 MAG: diguanylate cyclase [Sulfurimonas sp. RIFOXYD12_FULL_33_39]OHE15023.1 MAG: diguanylate cyclase [Sulfurimonas sp. RIFOXYD2_FULL_34_21]